MRTLWPQRPPVVRLVLFDIDGTLIRTGGAGVRAFGRTADILFGIQGASERMNFHGRTDVALVRELFRAHGIPDTFANVRHFLDTYVFLLDHQLEQDRGATLPGVHRLLAGLRQLSDPPAIGLLTGNIRLGAEIKLRAHALWEEFILGGFADDHESRNEIARVARIRGGQHLGRELDGDEIVVIGDTPLDVECARAIGARCLAVATGGFTADQLRSHRPRWTVADLETVEATELCA